VSGFHLKRGRFAWPLALAGILLVAIGVTLSGHVAGIDPSWPGQLALALHALTVAFWLGSLWPLHAALRVLPLDDAVILIRRFSVIAMPAVALLVGAGIIVALLHLPSWDSLWTSGYGRLLLLKLLAVAAMIVLALVNRRLVKKKLAAGRIEAKRALVRNINLELGLAALALLLTAVLGHTSPMAGAVGSAHAHMSAANVASASARANAYVLALTAEPGRAGSNQLVIHISDGNGMPVSASEVSVELSLPDAGIEPLRRETHEHSSGMYMPNDVFQLPVAGRWQVHVEVLISDFERIEFHAELSIR
jgi:copper transport protein